MRNTIMLGLLVLVVFVFGLPALLGWQLTKTHDQYAKALAVPGFVEVRNTAFSRGVLRSRSRVRLAPGARLCDAPECPEITVDSVIHHGPIPLTAPATTKGGLQLLRGVAVSRIEFAPLFRGFAFQPPLPALEVTTRVALDGTVSMQLQLPAARLRAESSDAQAGTRVSMGRLQAQAKVPPSHDSLRAQLTWPDFSLVADGGGQLDSQGMALDFSGDANAGLFWRHFSAQLDDFRAVGDQGKSLVLQGLRASARSKATAPGRLAGEFDLRISRMLAANREYGPVIIEGQTSGMDVASLQAIWSQLTSLSARGLPPELLLIAAHAVYQTHTPQLLEGGPALDINRLLIGTTDGDIVADLKFKMESGSNQNLELNALLKRISLQMNLRMPTPIMRHLVRLQLASRPGASDADAPPAPEQVDAVLAALVDGEFLAAQPQINAYSIAMSIEDQELVVNGKAREGWQALIDALAGSQ